MAYRVSGVAVAVLARRRRFARVVVRRTFAELEIGRLAKRASAIKQKKAPVVGERPVGAQVIAAALGKQIDKPAAVVAASAPVAVRVGGRAAVRGSLVRVATESGGAKLGAFVGSVVTETGSFFAVADVGGAVARRSGQKVARFADA